VQDPMHVDGKQTKWSRKRAIQAICKRFIGKVEMIGQVDSNHRPPGPVPRHERAMSVRVISALVAETPGGFGVGRR
jgi:hypothetical protein